MTPSTGANGYTVTTCATGFKAEPFNYGGVNWMGCPGVSEPAFKGDSAFLVNFRTGGVYKLGLDGGAASSADLLGTSAPTLGSPVFGKDGRLYATEAPRRMASPPGRWWNSTRRTAPSCGRWRPTCGARAAWSSTR